jgi:hypothetical protein
MKSETYYTVRTVVRGAFWLGFMWLTLAILATVAG